MIKTLDTAKAKLEIERIHNGRITLIGEYTRSTDKHTFHCNICGHEWQTTFASVFHGTGCANCLGMIQTDEDIVRDIAKVHGDKIKLLEVFKTDRKRIRLKCSVCGHIWEAVPKDVINKHKGCEPCAQKKRGILSRATQQEIDAKVYVVHKDDIRLNEAYKGWQNLKHEFYCNKCNHTWSATIWSVTGLKSGCPECKSSRGEKAVQQWLDDNGYDYKTQYQLNSKDRSRYDFRVNLASDIAFFLIEVQGIQHFEPVATFGGIHQLVETQKQDQLKADNCENYGVYLIRLRYEFKNTKDLTERLAKAVYNLEHGLQRGYVIDC